MAESRVLLEMKGIVKEFPGVRALKGVDFTVREGEVHALMGENGAGKSTLIKVLTGIYTKDGGTIHFDGREINPRSVLEAQKEGISTVYQELNLSPYQTVYENMYLGRELRKGPGMLDRKAMIRSCEETLDGLGIHVDVTKPLTSYGTAVQQMVAIGRAVSVNAKLVILDEATSSLDKKEVAVLFGIIRRLKEKNIAVIFISHKMDEVFEICERTTIMRNGELVKACDMKDLTQLSMISLMIGKEAKKMERTKKGYDFADAEVYAEMRDIRWKTRLNGLGIDIKKGEVVGLSGLLGAGRTELAKVLFGDTMPDSGEILWMGQEEKFRSPSDAINKAMGFCTEDRKLEGIFPHLSVRDNMTVALLPKISRGGVIPRKKQTEVVDQYIRSLAIKTPHQNQPIGSLSGGNQQKVLLARWMCTGPRLIILDEPTRGIDVGAKAEIEDLIQELASKGISILMISSEMAELERNCDRIIVLRDGRRAGELIGDEISQDAMMELMAKGGEEA